MILTAFQTKTAKKLAYYFNFLRFYLILQEFSEVWLELKMMMKNDDFIIKKYFTLRVLKPKKLPNLADVFPWFNPEIN